MIILAGALRFIANFEMIKPYVISSDIELVCNAEFREEEHFDFVF